MSSRFELHPIYGAIPRDGEQVSAGDLLGLSADGSGTIAAPHEGTVRLIRLAESGIGQLIAEILPLDIAEKEAGDGPASS